MSNPTNPSIRMGDELTPEEIEEIRNEKMIDEAQDYLEWHGEDD